jgi:hypothetical protein
VPFALGLTALAAAVLGDYPQAQALSERTVDVLPKDVKLMLRTKRDPTLSGR